jgi:hypothetical protein
MNIKLMLNYFRVDILIKFTIVDKDSLDFFNLVEDESVLFDKGSNGESSTCELIVDGYKIIKFLVIDSVLKLFDLIIK